MAQVSEPDRDEDEDARVLVVDPTGSGKRLDAYLAKALPHHSRSRWRSLIDAGWVAVDGRSARPALKLATGDRIEIDEPPPAPSGLVPQDLPLDVVFEDEDIIVINKVAGMVVHPGAGHPDGTLVNALLFRVPGLRVGGEERPGIVHRLDKDTSGLMVCAKNDEAHRALADAFRARTVDKRYRAFCLGKLPFDEKLLDTGHARDEKDRRRFTTKIPPPEEEGGGVRRALARYRVLQAAGGLSDVEVELMTGRTHQIRAQLADIGHPLAEDGLYGGATPAKRVGEGPVRLALAKLRRQALHAARLVFVHPRSSERLSFDAPLPEDLQRLADAIVEAGG